MGERRVPPMSPLLPGVGKSGRGGPPAGQSPAPAAKSGRSTHGGAVGSREKCSVAGVEAIGPYTLLRVRRGRLEPGVPGQFFMLEAPARLLPRPMSLCLAPPGELAFLIDPIGPGTRALCALEP